MIRGAGGVAVLPLNNQGRRQTGRLYLSYRGCYLTL
jgi:hypothetical protein